MNFDHFFTVGAQHLRQGTPCEDYSLSGAIEPEKRGFGVVCDGCSGARANTDVGARALAWSFQSAVSASSFSGEFNTSFVEQLRTRFQAAQFTDVFEDYLATLVGFYATESVIRLLVWGDGAVIYKQRDGWYVLKEFNWAQSMPFYLAYTLKPDVLAQFLEQSAAASSTPFTCSTTVFRMEEGRAAVLEKSVQCHPATELLNGFVVELNDVSNIESLAVVSDGIAQVGGQSPLAVAYEVLQLKTTQGDYLKRRMIRALKTWTKDGDLPTDDIAVAGVHYPVKAE